MESRLIIFMPVLICGVYQETLADDIYDQNSIDSLFIQAFLKRRSARKDTVLREMSGSEKAVPQCILTTKRTSEESIH